MTTIYIDPTASSAGDGSLATPFRSWNSVTWGANNTYLQKAGTIWAGDQIKPTTDGVTLGAYNISITAPYAKFNGANTGANVPAFSILAASANITIQDFDIYGCNGTIIGSSASTPKSTGAIVRRCRIHDSVNTISNGISIYGTNTLVQDCEIFNVDDAVWLSDDGSPTVERCKINDVGIDPTTFTGDCIQFNAHVGTAEVRNCKLSSTRDKQCVLGGNNGGPLHVYDTVMVSATWCVNTNLCDGAVEIKRCKMKAAKNVEGVGISTAGVTHQTVAGNMLVESCDFDCNGIWSNGIYCTATLPSGTITVRNCTFRNNASIAQQNAGLISLFGVGWVLVATNCAFNSSLTTTTAESWGSSIYAPQSTSITITKCSFQAEHFRMFWMNNVFYSTIAAMEGAGFGSGNITGDQLTVQGRPTASSPLVAAGTAATGTFDADHTPFWNPNPCIGAYELLRAKSAAGSARVMALP